MAIDARHHRRARRHRSVSRGDGRTTTVTAACGFVVPRHVSSVWERGRYVEYLLAFSFYKPIQDHYAKPLIASGCFSIYRTAVLRAHGGWQTRTMAEDMDLTWTHVQRGRAGALRAEARLLSDRAAQLHFMRKQLRRWSHGFMQNVQLHWRGCCRSASCARWSASRSGNRRSRRSSISVVVPLTALIWRQSADPAGLHPRRAGADGAGAHAGGSSAGSSGGRCAAFRRSSCLRVVNCLFVLEAIWSEMIVGRRLVLYEKGH